MDPSEDDKEHILVTKVAISNFSVADIMPNQQGKTVATPLVEKWFYV